MKIIKNIDIRKLFYSLVLLLFAICVDAAPTITAQPQSQSIGYGQSVTLKVSAAGKGTLTYKWYRDKTLLSSQTKSTLTETVYKTHTYYVDVTDSTGTTRSSTATVTVYDKPTITTKPDYQQSVGEGGTINFSVVATGGGTLFYRWYKEQTQVASGNDYTSYTISNAKASDAGNYKVVVSNDAGEVSWNWYLFVNSKPVDTKPSITTQPIGKNVTEGNLVTFSVGASGTSPLSYQWYKNGTTLSGANNTSYTIKSVQTSDAGSYTVKVTNSLGSVTSNAAELTVNAASADGPVITVQPQSQTVNEGASVTFSVEAEDAAGSDPDVNIELIRCKAGTFTMGSPKSELGRTTDDENQHQVTISKDFWMGKYEVTQEQYQAIMGKNPSEFVGDNYPVETVSWNDAMDFCSKLTAIERRANRLPDGYEYTLPTEEQWEYACRAGTTRAFNNGRNIPEQKMIKDFLCGWDFTSGTYGYYAVQLAHIAKYYYSKKGGFDSMTVRKAPGAVGEKDYLYNNRTSPNTWGLYDMHGNVAEWCLNYTVRGGGWNSYAGDVRSASRVPSFPGNRSNSVGFRVALVPSTSSSPSTTDTLTYQWYKNGAKISGATGSSYTINNVKTSDAGSYTVTISNSVGSVTSSAATLTVNPNPIVVKPTITTQPKSQTVTVGGSATFSVTANGTAPLSYQWYKNGVTLTGATATSSSYTISNVQSSDAGSYTVTVSNSAGSVPSSAATLTVTNPSGAMATIVMASDSTVTYGDNCGSLAGTKAGSEIIGSLLYNGKEIARQTFALSSKGAPTGKLRGGVIETDQVPAGTTVTLQLAAFDQGYLDHPSTGNYYYGISKPFEYHTGNPNDSTKLPDSKLVFDSFTIEKDGNPNPDSTLSSINISGPDRVSKGSTATYTCTATYSNGTSKTVTPTWSISSGGDYASITSAGILTGKAAGPATVKASYTEDGVTKTATENVTITSNPNPNGTAVRSVSRSGKSATVTLKITPKSGVSVIFVEEKVPSGVTVKVNDGGTYTADRNMLRWSFLDGNAREISYVLTVANSFTGKVSLSGEVTFDESPTAITGTNEIDFPNATHPADMDDDWEIVTREISSYALAWTKAQSWSREPADIPVTYVSRAALIWVNGGYYTYDSSKTEPSCWVSSSVKPASVELAASSSNTRKITSVSSNKNNVTLTVKPGSGISVYFVEERIPTGLGLNVSNISNNGTYVASRGLIRWSFLDGEARTLTYTLEAPSGYSGTVNVDGDVTFDEDTLTTSGDKKAVFGSTPTPTLSSISISGNASVYVASTATYTCTATYSNGTTKAVTPSWSVSPTTYATITSGGVLTGKSAGTVTVTASYTEGGVTKTATKSVTVNPNPSPTLSTISISGPDSVSKGSTATYTCTATYSNGTTKAVTPSWSVSPTSYATITSGGVLTGKSAGTVTVTASYGGKTATKIVTVTVPIVKPTITTQPKSQEVNEGSPVTFSVTATGTTPLSYQWYKGSTKISGATSASYKISSVKTSDAGSYKVTVTNSAGSVTSSVATLTVNVPVTLSSISISGSSSVNVGATATYTCTAKYSDGTSKTVTPSWSVSPTTYATITSGGVLTGKAAGTVTVTASYTEGGVTKTATKSVTVNPNPSPTLSSISISGPDSVNVGATATYTCTATYSDGSAKKVTPTWSISSGSTYVSITSAGVLTGRASGTATITASYSGKTATKNVTVTAPVVKPTITTQPKSQTVNEGGSVTFSVTATGTATLKYQWKKNGTAISGATSSTYKISSVKSSDAGSYTVTVSNSAGSVTSSAATLTVNPVVIDTITINGDSSVDVGSTATYTCTVKYSNGTSKTVKPTWSVSPTTYASITSAGVLTGKAAGTVTLKATYTEGGVTKVVTKSVTVKAGVVKPSITTQPKSQTVTEGNSVTFSVVATGTATLKYQWKKNGTAISGATSSSYKISSVKASDEGSYAVTVSNSAGSVTSSAAVLTVNPVLMLNSITIFANGTSLTVGRTTSLICKAYYNDGTTKTVMPIWSISSGINYASIDNEGNLTGDAAGTVEVQAKYTEGGVTKTATKPITIVPNPDPEPKPVITTQPKSQTVTEGNSVTFSVKATGTGLSYQWYKGSSKISGATKATCTISSAKTSDAGSYKVVVSNSAGSVTSSAATLKVVSNSISIRQENYGTKVTITFTGTLQESSDMKTWKNVTTQSPYTTSVWRGQKFYRSVQ